MGSFLGHVLPGILSILGGIWWSVKYPIKYLCRKKKTPSSFVSKAGFQRLEFIEGICKLTISILGMISEQFAPEGPHLKLYDFETKQWYRVKNWQHTTMYLFYAISGLVDIVVYSTNALPVALDKMMFSLAVFMEGFLFYYHIHGRDMVDVLVHQLLIVVTFGAAGCIFLEVFFRSLIVLELFRTSLCILHGTWLCQIGFVLYPPSGGPEWDPMDHNNIMFISVCFCWHYVFALLLMAVNYSVVNCVVRSKMKRVPAMEIGLLKTSERDQESEDEI